MCSLCVVAVEPALAGASGGGATQQEPEFEHFQRVNPRVKLQRFIERARRQEARAMQHALQVNEEQWQVIEPKLKKVRAYRDEAMGGGVPFQSGGFSHSFSTPPGSRGGGSFGGAGGFHFQGGVGGAGGFGHGSSSWRPLGREPTESDRICDQLQQLLYDRSATTEQITEKLAALQRARAKARRRWAQAQRELRKVLNLRQEAVLVMMGLLE
jgi:hypothetical protein